MLQGHLLGLYEKAVPPEWGWEQRIELLLICREVFKCIMDQIMIINQMIIPFNRKDKG